MGLIFWYQKKYLWNQKIIFWYHKVEFVISEKHIIYWYQEFEFFISEYHFYIKNSEFFYDIRKWFSDIKNSISWNQKITCFDITNSNSYQKMIFWYQKSIFWSRIFLYQEFKLLISINFSISEIKRRLINYRCIRNLG